MADESAWPQKLMDALNGVIQGDIVSGVKFYYYGPISNGLPLNAIDEERATDGEDAGANSGVEEPEPEETEEGFDVFEYYEFGGAEHGFAAITSQTCDINEQGNPMQPWVQVSPVMQLPKGFEGNLPAFLFPVPSPTGKGDWAVDLRFEMPLEKTFLGECKPIRPFKTEPEQLAFASALGRRRDRAALANSLVETVSQSLRKRRRKNSFKRLLKDEVHLVAINIDEGTRESPRAVRVHVVTNDEPSAEVRVAFEQWGEEASPACEKAGITLLLPVGLHNSTCVDLRQYQRWITIDLG